MPSRSRCAKRSSTSAALATLRGTSANLTAALMYRRQRRPRAVGRRRAGRAAPPRALPARRPRPAARRNRADARCGGALDRRRKHRRGQRDHRTALGRAPRDDPRASRPLVRARAGGAPRPGLRAGAPGARRPGGTRTACASTSPPTPCRGLVGERRRSPSTRSSASWSTSRCGGGRPRGSALPSRRAGRAAVVASVSDDAEPERRLRSLEAIEERVRQLHGKIELVGDGGTEVRVTLPARRRRRQRERRPAIVRRDNGAGQAAILLSLVADRLHAARGRGRPAAGRSFEDDGRIGVAGRRLALPGDPRPCAYPSA